MKRFLEFLTEGGNVKVDGLSADPIHVSEKSRAHIKSDIHHSLTALHNAVHNDTGAHLFGKDRKALHTGSAYSGSSKHLMSDHISDKEYAHHKPSTGDVDVQIPHEHKEDLHKHLKVGHHYGNYQVAGVKKHGNETTALMRHHTGAIHQFDFEHTHYHNHEPTKGEQFIHSADWNDTKHGIKGLHHKMLLHTVAGSKYKFTNTHGLRSRTNEKDPGDKDPVRVSKKLFGDKADHSHIHSFHGVTHLIKHHIPASEHGEIYNKFKEHMANGSKKINHAPAIQHLAKHLGIKDKLHESKEEAVHHTTVIPMVGFSPISHMGHAKDLGGKMKTLPGKKHIGISGKADHFSPHERTKILKRQWQSHDTEHHIVKTGAETIGKAYHSLPKHGKHVLHILVGGDRKEMAHGLKKSLEAGKVKEMNGHHFHEIHIHTPDDEHREHGMSGTNMRKAAHEGDHETFHKHLGHMFSKEESHKIMHKIKSGIDSGKIPLKRK